MAFIDKNTIENLIIILSGILLATGIKSAQYIGPYIVKYPLITVGIAVAMIAFHTKLMEFLSFMDKETSKGLIFILAGIFLFNGIASIPQVAVYLNQYAYIAIAVGVILLMAKNQISSIGG